MDKPSAGVHPRAQSCRLMEEPDQTDSMLASALTGDGDSPVPSDDTPISKEPPAVLEDLLEMESLNKLLGKFPVTLEALITAQKSDPSLANCFSFILKQECWEAACVPVPLPVLGELFEHVIVVCAGPLPKSGNQFLSTVMCTASMLLNVPKLFC